MTLLSRPSVFDARFLRRLVGTKITTFYDFDPLQQPSAVSLITAPTFSFSGSPPPVTGRAWIITEKLSERAVHLTQEDVDMGVGSPMTVGKYLCHLEEDPTQIAFMRIYYQIPVSGTENADLATLAQQIQPLEVCGELEMFRRLMSQGCNSVPRFLGYCQKAQGEHDLVPGGYAKYIIWEKVPGEPLTKEYFWSLDPLVREDIRAKFRVAFESVQLQQTQDGRQTNC